jgi:hypothetical protein
MFCIDKQANMVPLNKNRTIKTDIAETLLSYSQELIVEFQQEIRKILNQLENEMF